MMSLLPWFLSFCVGFLSLSVEILWVRVVSFKFHTMPHAFSFVLAMYLVGIAVGAYVGKLCCKHERHLYLIGAVVLLLSGTFDIMTPRFAGDLLSGGFDNEGLTSAALAIITAKLDVASKIRNRGCVDPTDKSGDRCSRMLADRKIKIPSPTIADK